MFYPSDQNDRERTGDCLEQYSKKIDIIARSKVGFEVAWERSVRLVKVDEELSSAGLLVDKV